MGSGSSTDDRNAGSALQQCARAPHRGGDILPRARGEQKSSRGENKHDWGFNEGLNLIILLMTRYGVNSSETWPWLISDLPMD